MKREEIIKKISGFAGPLGPWGIPEKVFKDTKDWIHSVELDSMDILIDLLIYDMPEKQIICEAEDFDLIVIDTIGALGKKNVHLVLKKVEFMLEVKHLRYKALCILGEILSLECLSFLEVISKNDDLTEDEVYDLILTLMWIDKKKAFEVFADINSRYAEKYPATISKLDNELNK